MKVIAGIFALLMIFGDTNVEVAELNFQELRSGIIMPVLPDRIRHRKDNRRLRRPSPPQIEVPSRRPIKQPERYTQRQPKNPPHVRAPKLPQRHSPSRGSRTPKRFGPPRF